MKTITVENKDNVVKSLRQIRDEVSGEIENMTFAQERSFLDNVLKSKNRADSNDKTDLKDLKN